MQAPLLRRERSVYEPLGCAQVLQDAAAIDAKAANGANVTPLCGLPLAVKDAIDVLGYVTEHCRSHLANSRTHDACSAVTARYSNVSLLANK